MPTLFIPYEEWKPDLAEFGHDGLIDVSGAIPLGDTYVPMPIWEEAAGVLPATPTGYWIHATDAGAGFTGYVGTDTKLYELNTTSSVPWTRVDKTRLVGGNYAAADSKSGWQGASFGDAVIMTNYTDDPQLLTSPAAANFVKLASSTFDPKAKFAFPVRNNMVLANLNLALAFDGLAAGANPFTVCWSQTDNVRQYGSFNVTPQLTGTGYQLLAYDLGYITGGIGGEYGLIAMQRGWVRMDGPPYSFSPISEGNGCIYPNSIVRLGEDVYFWGAGGPAVLRGGDGQAIQLTANRLIRAMTDRVGFPNIAPRLAAVPIYVSAAADHINNMVWFSYVRDNSVTTPRQSNILVYDATNDRFGYGPVAFGSGSHGVYFLGNVPAPASTDAIFCPGRDITGIIFEAGTANTYPSQPSHSLADSTVTMTTGYRRLHEELTTRITRVRLIYSLSTGSGNPGDSQSFTIYSKNKPYDTATAVGAFTTFDTHGAIPTPGTYMSDFHKISMTFLPVTMLVLEMSGIEVDYETGGKYSA